MQPQLTPVAHVPIETLPSGAVSNPELTISSLRGSPVLYVRRPGSTSPWDYAAEVLVWDLSRVP